MKLNRKIIGSLFISMLMIFCINCKVEASYSATSQTVKSGATVSITVESTEKLESFDLECTDVGGLTYKSCSSSVTGAVVNSSGKKISYAVIGGEATTLGTYTFTAPEVTEQKKYTVKFDINGETVSSTITVKAKETTPPADTNNNTTTDNNNTTTNGNTNTNSNTNSGTTTTTPKEKSKDANLSTLGVTPKEYDFSGFSKNKTSYSVTVPSDVDSLKVLYKTADSNAKVKVTGNSGFEAGSDNEIKIVVTAEDGKTTKTYTIKVTKLAEEEEKPGNLIENEEEIYLTSLELEGIEISPEFTKDTYSYTARLTDSSLNEVKIKAIANNEDAKVEISGNTDLVEGENAINIVVTIEGSTEQKVYQIVVTKEAVLEPATGVLDNTPTTGTDLIGTIKNYAVIAIAVVILMMVAVIVLIILLRRENKRLNEEDDEADEIEKETLEEINRETERIFSPKVESQSEKYVLEEEPKERRNRRKERGKHSK